MHYRVGLRSEHEENSARGQVDKKAEEKKNKGDRMTLYVIPIPFLEPCRDSR